MEISKIFSIFALKIFKSILIMNKENICCVAALAVIFAYFVGKHYGKSEQEAKYHDEIRKMNIEVNELKSQMQQI